MANNNKHTGPNVPALRFPEFSGEWIESKLGDIADFSKGAGISKDQRSEKGNPCILYGELYTRYKSEVITNVFSKTALPDSDLVKSKANDIIIPASGETAEDIATARCVPFDNILLGGDLNIIRLHEQDGKFFSYQLNGVRKYDIATVAQGVSVVHLHAGDLKGITVKYPSHIAEQEKISQILGLIDDRIATQSKIIEEQETLLKSLADSLIYSQDANMALNDCVVARSSAMKESELENSGPFPVFGASGLCGYSNEALEESDSILVTKDGSGVGTCQYATGAHSFLGTLCSLTAKEGVDLPYVYYALLNFNFASFKTGLAIPHIYFKDYGTAVFYCPSYDEQVRIASGLEKIEAKIKSDKELLKQYQLQKEYLLSRMFI